MTSMVQALLYFPIYLACIALAGLLWAQPMLLVAIYLALTAALLYKWHSRSDLIYYFVPFVLGPAGELFPVLMGSWKYSLAPHHIPLWLPFVWGVAGLFMKKTSEALVVRPQPSI